MAAVPDAVTAKPEYSVNAVEMEPAVGYALAILMVCPSMVIAVLDAKPRASWVARAMAAALRMAPDQSVQIRHSGIGSEIHEPRQALLPPEYRG